MSASHESLPRGKLIRRRTVFEATRNKGRRVSNRYLAINYLARDAVQSGETGSVAFLTPKRLGSAAIRNKLRRRMREIYRRHLARPEEPAFLVWIARPAALELDFDGLKQTMSGLRKKIGDEGKK